MTFTWDRGFPINVTLSAPRIFANASTTNPTPPRRVIRDMEVNFLKSELTPGCETTAILLLHSSTPSIRTKIGACRFSTGPESFARKGCEKFKHDFALMMTRAAGGKGWPASRTVPPTVGKSLARPACLPANSRKLHD
jgi:hypothetical protein